MSVAIDPFADERAAYNTSPGANEEWGEVHLDGVPIPVVGPVNATNLAVMQPKFTVGEPNKDSDNTMSVWSMEDWTGGGQIATLNALSDVNRFRYSTIETRYPKIITLPPETTSYSISGATGAAQPIGDYKPAATTLFWAAFGTALKQWDKGTSAFINGATLTAVPVNKGIVWDGLLWIPEGVNGYDCWDGTVITHHAPTTTSPQPVAFCEWDDKIVALGADGQVSMWDGFTWNMPAELKLRGDRVPRNLITWWTPMREPAVYVVTNRDVWVVDPLIPTLYMTGLHFPVHPDMGLASLAWRDDSMYVSIGTGVMQLSLGGVITPMGLDRDDGLPSYLRGAIVDFEGEFNSYFALVQGIGTTTVTIDSTVGPRLDEIPVFGDGLYGPVGSTQARASLQRWTGMGWHTAWESPDSSGVPSRVSVSQADSEYQVWWGYGANMYRQLLHRSYHNPRQGAELGIDRFAPSGFLRTGRFDGNMAMFLKLASHLDVHLDPLSTNTVDVWYQTDRTYPNWIELGSCTAPGQNVLPFNVDSNGFSSGLSWRWIELEFRMSSTDPLKTPIMLWTALKFIKLPLQGRSWDFQVSLTAPEEWKDKGPRDIADFLDNLATANRFFSFKHQDRLYRVRLAQVRGPEPTGLQRTGIRSVSLIELDPTSEINVGPY